MAEIFCLTACESQSPTSVFASNPACNSTRNIGSRTIARIAKVVNPAASRGREPQRPTNQRCSGRKTTTSSTERNSGSRKLAITRRNSAAIASKIAASVINETMRDIRRLRRARDKKPPLYGGGSSGTMAVCVFARRCLILAHA